jgi:hypothetical protein
MHHHAKIRQWVLDDAETHSTLVDVSVKGTALRGELATFVLNLFREERLLLKLGDG